MSRPCRHIPESVQPKVELQVDEDETLGAVLGRVAEPWGIVSEHGSVAGTIAFFELYRPDHRPMMHVELALLDSDGRVYFTHDWKNASYRDLISAHGAGLIQGDPRRPYLILQPGVGNGTLIDWQTLEAIWSLFEHALGLLSDAGGAYAAKKLIYDKLRGRSKDAREVVRDNAEVRPGSAGRQ